MIIHSPIQGKIIILVNGVSCTSVAMLLLLCFIGWVHLMLSRVLFMCKYENHLETKKNTNSIIIRQIGSTFRSVSKNVLGFKTGHTY